MNPDLPFSKSNSFEDINKSKNSKHTKNNNSSAKKDSNLNGSNNNS